MSGQDTRNTHIRRMADGKSVTHPGARVPSAVISQSPVPRRKTKYSILSVIVRARRAAQERESAWHARAERQVSLDIEITGLLQAAFLLGSLLRARG